jgi:phage baseplate assembly protein W
MDASLSGFAFPFRIVDGGVQRARDVQKIEDDLRHLLSVRLGERVMLRTYGGGVHHRLQEANDATLRALVKHEIEEGLRTFLPAVQLTAPLALTSRDAELMIALEYRADPLDVVRRLELRVP